MCLVQFAHSSKPQPDLPTRKKTASFSLTTRPVATIAILACINGITALPNANAQTSGHGLNGAYYANTTLDGTPVLSRVDSNLRFVWTGSPGKNVPATKFSVRWSGYITPPATGKYRFKLKTDAGCRLFVNNALIINDWGPHTLTSKTGWVSLTSGRKYPISVEYQCDVRSGVARMYWITPTTPTEVIVPSEVLSPDTVATPASTAAFAPTNLRVKAIWNNGGPTDLLAWTPSSSAVSYNIYQYDRKIGDQVKGTNFLVPNNLWCVGMEYTVTAVDGSGQESLASPPAMAAQPADAPNSNPVWIPSLPVVPTNLVVTPEWNAGVPRNVVSWYGDGSCFFYNVYRNNVLVASNLWCLHYIDNDVVPGQKYTYQVSGGNTSKLVDRESALTQPVTVTTLTASPVKSIGTISSVTVIPNDDSVILQFPPVAGAVDYRAYNVAKPTSFKYSGGGLAIEMNGLDPSITNQFIVEAVDKFGPFQKQDGNLGHGSTYNGKPQVNTNGQGDPSNVPNVVAQSAVISTTCKPRVLTGSQIFFDNFRNSQPLVPATPPKELADFNAQQVWAMKNDKWTVYNLLGDQFASQIFIMSNHFMDTLYDGGTAGQTNVVHNNNSSLVITPNATADISGGKVLHVTMEVDAHMSARRWCEIMIAEAGDPLICPGKFLDAGVAPTIKGNNLIWSIEKETQRVEYVRLVNKKTNITQVLNVDWNTGATDRFGPANRQTPDRQGDHTTLDLRHRFDLYVSSNHVMGMEGGTVVFDKLLPNQLVIPYNQVAIYFIHELYHTWNERPEEIFNAHQLAGDTQYWYDYRSWADERHWDNMGFEVLNGFPKVATAPGP